MEYVILAIVLIVGYYYFRKNRTSNSTPVFTKESQPAYKWTLSVVPDWDKIIDRKFPDLSDEKKAEVIDTFREQESDGDLGCYYEFEEFCVPEQNFYIRKQRKNPRYPWKEKKEFTVDELEFGAVRMLGAEIGILNLEEGERVKFGEDLFLNKLTISPDGIREHVDTPIGPSEPGDYLHEFPIHFISSFFYHIGCKFPRSAESEVIKWPNAMRELLEGNGLKYKVYYDNWYSDDSDPKPLNMNEYDPDLWEWLGKPEIAFGNRGTHVFTSELCEYQFRINVFSEDVWGEIPIINKDWIRQFGSLNFDEYVKRNLEDK